MADDGRAGGFCHRCRQWGHTRDSRICPFTRLDELRGMYGHRGMYPPGDPRRPGRLAREAFYREREMERRRIQEVVRRMELSARRAEIRRDHLRRIFFLERANRLENAAAAADAAAAETGAPGNVVIDPTLQWLFDNMLNEQPTYSLAEARRRHAAVFLAPTASTPNHQQPSRPQMTNQQQSRTMTGHVPIIQGQQQPQTPGQTGPQSSISQNNSVSMTATQQSVIGNQNSTGEVGQTGLQQQVHVHQMNPSGVNQHSVQMQQPQQSGQTQGIDSTTGQMMGHTMQMGGQTMNMTQPSQQPIHLLEICGICRQRYIRPPARRCKNLNHPICDQCFIIYKTKMKKPEHALKCPFLTNDGGFCGSPFV